MNITVIGLGLIGGSFGKSLRHISENYHVIGCDASEQHEKKAKALGLVHECLPVKEATAKSDIVLLAVPVDRIPKMLTEILDHVREDQLIIDFGSTKLEIAKSVSQHQNRRNYLSAHPMAGTENTGPEAALTGLFKDKILIICDEGLTDPILLEKAKKIFDQLAFDIIYMDSDSHDHHIAYVSHLSHVSSFMLGLTVLDESKDANNIFNMAGSGFNSTVRLAMSSPEMWKPIFLQNKNNVSKALGEYIGYLEKFKDALERADDEALNGMMRRANLIRKTLQKP